MDRARRSSHEPEHVRDVSRSERDVQRCQCGHVTRTLDEMRRHVAHPELDEAPTAHRLAPPSWFSGR